MTTQTPWRDPTNVFLEVGSKRVFACALEWPGWCRGGKSEEHAVDALAAYAERYAAVARAAGIDFPYTRTTTFHVVERLPGKVGYTDFGVPGEVAEHDRDPLTTDDATRLTSLVKAAWIVFDRVVAATPAELRKGPRGGGRDRDQLIDHALGAETSYARKLGVKHRQPALGDALAITNLRDDILAALQKPTDGASPVLAGWPPRYAARRIAWHVLDHAWEMEDRRDPI